jgi:hypothetical protein
MWLRIPRHGSGKGYRLAFVGIGAAVRPGETSRDSLPEKKVKKITASAGKRRAERQARPAPAGLAHRWRMPAV